MNWRALVSVLLLSSTAAAQVPVQAIPPGDDKIVPLEQGEKAPYTGQLFDQPTALRWGNWLLQYKYRLEWDVQYEKKVCAADVSYRDKLLVIERERAATVEADLLQRLERSEQARLRAEEEARNPSWYQGRDFGIVLGVAGTVGIMALSIWALEARN